MELAASRIADSGMRRLGTVIDKATIVPASTDERQFRADPLDLAVLDQDSRRPFDEALQPFV